MSLEHDLVVVFDDRVVEEPGPEALDAAVDPSWPRRMINFAWLRILGAREFVWVTTHCSPSRLLMDLVDVPSRAGALHIRLRATRAPWNHPVEGIDCTVRLPLRNVDASILRLVGPVPATRIALMHGHAEGAAQWEMRFRHG